MARKTRLTVKRMRLHVIWRSYFYNYCGHWYQWSSLKGAIYIEKESTCYIFYTDLEVRGNAMPSFSLVRNSKGAGIRELWRIWYRSGNWVGCCFNLGSLKMISKNYFSAELPDSAAVLYSWFQPHLFEKTEIKIKILFSLGHIQISWKLLWPASKFVGWQDLCPMLRNDSLSLTGTISQSISYKT